MIKKLRKRFIVIALSVVAAVIVVIVAGIDVANYVDMKRDADTIISFVENTPSGGKMGAEQIGGAPVGDFVDPRSGNFPKDMPREISFSARYFRVNVDLGGNVLTADLDRIAMVKESDLSSLVQEATKERGFVGNYRYHRQETAEGYTYLFLDCEKEIDTCRTFILSSIIITAVGLAVIAIFVILLSKMALAPVEESYKKQKRFITDAGHELKTPLTVINANTELLELEVGEDNEWIRSIKGQVQKLAKLTKELVFLSRVDEAEGMVQMAPFSLKSALEDCLEEFKEAALVAKKTFVLDAEEISLMGNEEMIRRAAALLIDNAIKYAEGEEIALSLAKEGKWVVLTTSNAASLSKGEHPELFERFYRGDLSHSNTIGGHGVGLSVVKAIAEAHGGDATCTSDGATLTFRLTFPFKKTQSDHNAGQVRVGK